MSYIALYTCPKLTQPYDHPANRDFEALAEQIMETVSHAPGYVRFVDFPEKMPWPNYVDEETDYPALTLSVWTDIGALFNYSYRDDLHRRALKQRRDWFPRANHPIYVLWYVEDPDKVTYEQAVERMNFLCDHGPGPYAFDFQHLYDELGNAVHRSYATQPN